MTARPRILVACVGNIFLGDDAFGCEVASALARRELPGEVRVVDFGIRGFDLAYALMDGYDAAIIVDAVPRGAAPGTLYAVEPDLREADGLSAEESAVEPHGMNPWKALSMVRAMGGEFGRVLLVGCEPESTGAEGEGRMGLSEAVRASVEEAAGMVETLAARILAGDWDEATV